MATEFLILVSLVMFFIYNISTVYLVSDILDSKIKINYSILICFLNIFLLSLFNYYSLPVYIIYIVFLFIIYFEFRILFEKNIKILSCFFCCLLFLINLILIENFVSSVVCKILGIDIYHFRIDLNVYYLVFSITFILATLSIFIFKKFIKVRNFKFIFQSNTQSILLLVFMFFVFIYIVFDGIMFEYEQGFENQWLFLCVTVIASYSAFSTIFYASLKIIKYISFENRIKKLEENLELSIISNRRLKELAFRDSLTGCFNRDYLIDFLNESIEKKTFPLCVCFIDVDKLKFVNDTFGHIEGDEYLKIICKIFFHFIRRDDVISRIGGDEFVIIFQNVNKNYVNGIIKRVQKNIIFYQQKLKKNYKMSISYGCVEINKEDDYTVDKILKMADKEMYEMKKNK